MTRLTRLCRAVGVGLAVTTATLAMTQVANAAPAPPTLPGNAQNIAVDTARTRCSWSATCQGRRRADLQVRRHRQLGLRRPSPRRRWSADNDKNVIAALRGPTWTATDGSTVGGTVLQTGDRRPDRNSVALASGRLAYRRRRRRHAGGHHLHPAGQHQRRSLSTAGTCDPTVTPEARVPYTGRLLLLESDRPRLPLIGRIDLPNGRSRIVWERPFLLSRCLTSPHRS